MCRLSSHQKKRKRKNRKGPLVIRIPDPGSPQDTDRSWGSSLLSLSIRVKGRDVYVAIEDVSLTCGFSASGDAAYCRVSRLGHPRVLRLCFSRWPNHSRAPRRPRCGIQASCDWFVWSSGGWSKHHKGPHQHEGKQASLSPCLERHPRLSQP